MFIVSKDRKSIVNSEKVTSIYVGADGCTIKANFQNDGGCQFASYNSERYSQIAMDILAKSFGKLEVFFMPEDNFINAKLNLLEHKNHHNTGKKTKGHGGS